MKPISEHVRAAFPCQAKSICKPNDHRPYCPAHNQREATRLAAAVRAECMGLLVEAKDLLIDSDAMLDPRMSKPLERGEITRVARPIRKPAECAEAIRNLLARIDGAVG